MSEPWGGGGGLKVTAPVRQGPTPGSSECALTPEFISAGVRASFFTRCIYFDKHVWESLKKTKHWRPQKKVFFYF